MEYGCQATTNNIHRTQDREVISDGLVPGTIITVGSLKQVRLMKNVFVQPAWNMGFKLLLTTFIVRRNM